MKVCFLSRCDGGAGGAYTAAYRLHRGLLKAQVDSMMLVGKKIGEDFTILEAQNNYFERVHGQIAPILDKLPLKLYPNRSLTSSYSVQWFPERIAPKIAPLDLDILHLHWISSGYLQIETLSKFDKPLVWTLHDMWPFTGGCHISQSCDRYTGSCGACPQLNSQNNLDISRWIWNRKAKAWNKLNCTIVTPSEWLAQCAKQSSLFKSFSIKVIPNGLDTNIYKPLERSWARDALQLPQDKQLILVGAVKINSDPNKGLHLLQSALQQLRNSKLLDNNLEVLVVGASEPSTKIDLGFPVTYLGWLHDDVSLALAYSAATVTVVPSIQESFGQTASESLACGTPVVAFNATGLRDIVDHQQNGYLATPYEVDDLARGILWVLENPNRYALLSQAARNKAEREFNQELQAQRYLSLYQEIINK